jgi:3,4-dihydroxyphenylacetate 2,3-dioxygenase
VRGDHAQVVDNFDTFMTVRPEAHFGHYQIMVAALGGRDCTAPGRLFSQYENAIGTGQIHVWFDEPANGWTGDKQ